ncbi:MAG: glycosyl hydrolase family 28-related protein [Methylocystis sp.]|uniref:glycosyl hydrolase family 28-related protein n=1 Tax=Methylocystis sp. TaxID=1911079 RepID=UPI003DA38E6B
MAEKEFYGDLISEVADLMISRRNFVQAAAVASQTSSPIDRQTSEVARVMTLAGLRVIEPSPASEITLSGYHAPGDGGEGMFRGVTGAKPGSYVDNGGTVILPKGGNGSAAWIRLHSGPVNVRWFGAKGDGVTNDQPAIQAAIDWVIYRKKVQPAPIGPYPDGVVYFPSGVYVTNDTLHVGYGYGSYSQVILQGDGKLHLGASGGVGGFAGTLLKPSNNDRPAIAISGGEAVYIRDMSFRGNHYSFIQSNSLGAHPPAFYDVDVTTWQDPAFPANAYSQYAPHCAIAIDPYSGAPHATTYPTVNYPSWLGPMFGLPAPRQYNRFSYTSQVYLDNVNITGFVVGVMVKPNNDNSGDYTKLRGCFISHCLYGVSIGQTQSRLVAIRDSLFTRVHTCITTVTHGLQQGMPSIKCDSVEFNSTIYALRVATLGSGGMLTLDNCYGEDIYSLGYGSTTANNSLTSAKFTGCNFNFQSSWGSRGVPTAVYDAVGGSGAVFKDCQFNIDTSLFLLFKGQANAFSFENVTVLSGTATNKLYEKNALNATRGIVVTGNTTLITRVHQFNVFANQYDMTTGASAGSGWQNKFDVQGSRQFGIPIYARMVGWTGDVPGFEINHQTFSYDKATAASISQTGRTVTVDLTSSVGFSPTDFAQKGGDVGDIVVDQTTFTLFLVAGRTGNILSLIAYTNIDSSGNLIPTIGATGSFFVANCRRYTPMFGTNGTFTSGSNVITAVARPDGSSTHIVSATQGVQANDFVYVGNAQYYAMVSAANAQITAVDNVAKTITMAGNSTVSPSPQTGRLAMFVRAATANNT